jgi:hypothetical protein
MNRMTGEVEGRIEADRTMEGLFCGEEEE